MTAKIQVSMKIQKFIFFALIILSIQSCTFMKTGISKNKHEERIKEKLNYETAHDSTTNYISKKQAIKIAKKELYKTYGYWNINFQRPFIKVFSGPYFYMSGTLLKGVYGGVFFIMIDREDKSVVYMFHTK